MRSARLLCVQRMTRGTFLVPRSTVGPLAVVRRSYSTPTPPPQQEAPATSQAQALDVFRPRANEERPRTYDRIAAEPFSPEVSKILQAPLDSKDIEITPDGLIYLPEIRYRRILNKAIGPGGWALMPVSPPVQDRNNVYRAYALYCYGRFVSEATGEQQFFASSSIATASEAAKSNALVRCCKDIGIGSELWDPTFIMGWKKQNVVEVWCENMKDHTKKKLWRRVDRPVFGWPFKEIKIENTAHAAPKMPLEAAHDSFSQQIYDDASSAPFEDESAPPQPAKAPQSRPVPAQQFAQTAKPAAPKPPVKQASPTPKA